MKVKNERTVAIHRFVYNTNLVYLRPTLISRTGYRFSSKIKKERDKKKHGHNIRESSPTAQSIVAAVARKRLYLPVHVECERWSKRGQGRMQNKYTQSKLYNIIGVAGFLFIFFPNGVCLSKTIIRLAI